jgi:hypothetical protein
LSNNNERCYSNFLATFREVNTALEYTAKGAVISNPIHLHGISPDECRYIQTARQQLSTSRRRRPGRPAWPMSTFERRLVIDGTHYKEISNKQCLCSVRKPNERVPISVLRMYCQFPLSHSRLPGCTTGRCRFGWPESTLHATVFLSEHCSVFCF